MSRPRKKSSKLRIRKRIIEALGRAFVFGGIAFLALSLYLFTKEGGWPDDRRDGPSGLTSQAGDLTFDDGPIKADESILDNPSRDYRVERVIIPSVGIDVSVRDADVLNGRWRVYEDSASFGLGSALPGETGNSVIFAHARERLFLPLRKIKNYALVYVLVSGGWYSFRVFETKEVSPDDISVIKDSDDARLTLYTCSGFADSKRLIVTAKKV